MKLFTVCLVSASLAFASVAHAQYYDPQVANEIRAAQEQQQRQWQQEQQNAELQRALDTQEQQRQERWQQMEQRQQNDYGRKTYDGYGVER